VLNAIPATAGSVSTSYLVDGSVTQAKVASGVVGVGPAFKIKMSANQTFSHNTTTVINFDTGTIDTASCLNAANKRVIPNVAGYYQVTLQVKVLENSSRNYYYEMIARKNGTKFALAILGHPATGGSEQSLTTSCIVYCNGSTDYIDGTFYPYDYTSSSTVSVDSSEGNTFLSGFLMRTT
jgi:hypothetical protein